MCIQQTPKARIIVIITRLYKFLRTETLRCSRMSAGLGPAAVHATTVCRLRRYRGAAQHPLPESGLAGVARGVELK